MSVILHGPKGRIPVRGIVDSGADTSTYPVEYAPILGIDLTDCREEDCKTAGGPTKQYTWDKTIEGQIQSMQNMRIPLSATFCVGLETVLLGRSDFFQAFRVNFDHRAQSFTLEPY